jgi:AcrR family transcriptional regulator
MQYLSQRLAKESAKGRAERRPSGALATSQRERILAATEQLIGEAGCAGASIEAIVKIAGVSSVTFYEHFPDKEACFVAAFDRAVGEARDALVEGMPRGLAWPDQVREGLRALLEMIEAEPERACMCLVEAQRGGAALATRYDAILDEAVAWLRRKRTLDPSAPEVTDTVEEATVGGIAWLLGERLERGKASALSGLLAKLVEIALSPYVGDVGEEPLPAAAESA